MRKTEHQKYLEYKAQENELKMKQRLSETDIILNNQGAAECIKLFMMQMVWEVRLSRKVAVADIRSCAND